MVLLNFYLQEIHQSHPELHVSPTLYTVIVISIRPAFPIRTAGRRSAHIVACATNARAAVHHFAPLPRVFCEGGFYEAAFDAQHQYHLPVCRTVPGRSPCRLRAERLAGALYSGNLRRAGHYAGSAGSAPAREPQQRNAPAGHAGGKRLRPTAPQ